MSIPIGWVALSRERGGRNLMGSKCPTCEQVELRPRVRCSSCGEALTSLAELKAREGLMDVKFTRDGRLFSIDRIRVEDQPIEVSGTVFSPRITVEEKVKEVK